MGCIIGDQDTIEAARFTALPRGKVVKAQSVVLLDRYEGNKAGLQVVLIKLADGEFTVAGRRHAPNGNWAVLDYGTDQLEKNVLTGLVKMGFVTQRDVDDHINRAQARKEARSRKWAIESLERACADLGIAVPEIPS